MSPSALYVPISATMQVPESESAQRERHTCACVPGQNGEEKANGGKAETERDKGVEGGCRGLGRAVFFLVPAYLAWLL